MAFPSVAATNSGRTTTTNTTSHAITLPSGIVAGNLLLVVFSVDGNPTCSANTAASGTNWTKLGQSSNGSIVTGAIFWKIADGGDALTIDTSATEQSSHTSYRITGGYFVDGTAANGSSTNSDPPNHTPSDSTQDYLWIETRSGDSTVVATAANGSFTNLLTLAAAGTGGASSNSAERQLNASSHDPAAFTSASEQWVSYTLAVSPVAPTERVRYVNTASSAGGDGTTNATSGATRAYATLKACITAELAAVGNLVNNKKYLTIHCEGSTADTSGGGGPHAQFTTSWITSKWNTIRIVVDQSVRHDGKWNTAKYRFQSGYDTFDLGVSNITLEGLQILAGSGVDDNTHKGIYIRPACDNVTVRECLIQLDIASQVSFGNTSYGIFGGVDATGTRYLLNNIIYDFSKTSSSGIHVTNHSSGNTYAYHNTILACTNGIEDGFSDIIAKNNLVTDCTAPFTGSFNASSNYNVTDAATAPGANSKVSQTITYTNKAARDLHTADTDAQVANNLYADATLPVTIDIDGGARLSSGDVYAGADEAVGGSPYTLTAAAGAFALTGPATGLKAARLLTATSRSYALSGNAANLLRGFRLTAGTGAFSLTFNAANFLRAEQLVAGTGAYSLTGQAAGLLRGLRLTAGTGAFNLTGNDVTLTYTPFSGAYTLDAGTPGAFVLTGNATGLVAARKLTASQASFTLTGNNAGLVASRKLAADSGTFTLTGNAATLTKAGPAAYTLTAGTGGFVFTEHAAQLTQTVFGATVRVGGTGPRTKRKQRREVIELKPRPVPAPEPFTPALQLEAAPEEPFTAERELTARTAYVRQLYEDDQRQQKREKNRKRTISVITLLDQLV